MVSRLWGDYFEELCEGQGVNRDERAPYHGCLERSGVQRSNHDARACPQGVGQRPVERSVNQVAEKAFCPLGGRYESIDHGRRSRSGVFGRVVIATWRVLR